MCVLAHPPAVILEGPRGSGARVPLRSPLPLTPRYVRGAAGSERTVERSLTDAKAFPHNARLQLAAMRSLLAAGLRDTAALAPVDPPTHAHGRASPLSPARRRRADAAPRLRRSWPRAGATSSPRPSRTSPPTAKSRSGARPLPRRVRGGAAAWTDSLCGCGVRADRGRAAPDHAGARRARRLARHARLCVAACSVRTRKLPRGHARLRRPA